LIFLDCKLKAYCYAKKDEVGSGDTKRLLEDIVNSLILFLIANLERIAMPKKTGLVVGIQIFCCVALKLAKV